MPKRVVGMKMPLASACGGLGKGAGDGVGVAGASGWLQAEVHVYVFGQAFDEPDLGLRPVRIGEALRDLHREADVLREDELLVVPAHLRYGSVVEVEEYGRDDLTEGACRRRDVRGRDLLREQEQNAGDDDEQRDDGRDHAQEETLVGLHLRLKVVLVDVFKVDGDEVREEV